MSATRNMNLKQETFEEGLKAAPAIGGAAYSYLTLNEWVALATLIYIIIQAIILIHKHALFIKDRNNNDT